MTITYGENVWSYDNGDWARKDENKYCHLMRLVNGQWIELTENIKATWVGLYPNGDWVWEDKDGYYHLMRIVNDKWIELTKDMKVVYIEEINNGVYQIINTEIWILQNSEWKYKDKQDFFNYAQTLI
jgi:hypothetical protein